MRQIIVDLNKVRGNELTTTESLKQGENLSTELAVILNEAMTGYDYFFTFQNNDLQTIVTENLNEINGQVKYEIVNSLITQKGYLRTELTAFEQKRILKSIIIRIPIVESLDESETEVPEVIYPWYVQAVEQSAIATNQAERAQNISDNFEDVILPNAVQSVETAGQAKVDLATEQANAAAQSAIDAENLAASVVAHKAEIMPHEFINLKTGKKYRYGYQISTEGEPQIIYEEVI